MAENKNDAWYREAASVARQFVMMFNGAMLYGSDHPNVAKGAAAFAEQINAIFYHRDMITFIVANGTLMVEDWPLDKSFNCTKILAHFDKLCLTSVSFQRGVSAGAVARLAAVAGNPANIEERRMELAEVIAGGIPLIRVNYILFGKIKADEVIVKEGSAQAQATGAFAPPPGYWQDQHPQYQQQQYQLLQQQQYRQDPPLQYQQQQQYQQLQQYPQQNQYAPPAPAAVNYDDAFLPPVTAGSLSRESLAQIEEVLTLSSLIERPKEISAALAQADSGELQNVFGKIKGEIDGSSIGIDTLLTSLYSMKQDLYQAIEVQKATGRVMHSAETINKEINDLTSRAIVKLIRDEYRFGKTPLNRLAHTIRRMLPGNAELMQILPGMKEMLLADGMTLGDYLELVSMLGLKNGERGTVRLAQGSGRVYGRVGHRPRGGDTVQARRSRPPDTLGVGNKTGRGRRRPEPVRRTDRLHRRRLFQNGRADMYRQRPERHAETGAGAARNAGVWPARQTEQHPARHTERCQTAPDRTLQRRLRGGKRVAPREQKTAGGEQGKNARRIAEPKQPLFPDEQGDQAQHTLQDTVFHGSGIDRERNPSKRRGLARARRHRGTPAAAVCARRSHAARRRHDRHSGQRRPRTADNAADDRRRRDVDSKTAHNPKNRRNRLYIRESADIPGDKSLVGFHDRGHQRPEDLHGLGTRESPQGKALTPRYFRYAAFVPASSNFTDTIVDTPDSCCVTP
jgi:hypothetical protein